MLKKRKPAFSEPRATATSIQWKTILKSDEQSFLTDNQLSAFMDETGPGCARSHFYPLPFAHEFSGSKWSFEELVNHDSLRSEGPKLDLKARGVKLEFLPHLLKKNFCTGKTTMMERSTISGNVLLVEWTAEDALTTSIQFSLPYFDAEVETFSNGICAAIKKQVFAVLAVSGVENIAFVAEEKPFKCSADIQMKKGKKVYLAYVCGYDKTAAVRAASHAVKNPESIFSAAERTWDDYFGRVVPRFSCSDKKLEQLYYYQAYVTRANLYDIPYEPFTHPYTCPWKTGAVWQWSWNTPMDSVAERWLNDKQIGAGGILLEGDNGGALNIGSYLHPTKKIRGFRGHNEHCQLIGRFLKKLPSKIDLTVCTTIPHTTPNGLLGAWELYLCSGDKQYLRGALAVMREAETEFSRHELPSGLYTTRFVDEFDYSLRLKPFIKAFKKGDPEMMLKMDTDFIAIDYNCYLYALREKMIEAANVLGVEIDGDKLRQKNERLKAAINKYLWNEKDGYYYDTDPRTMKHSKVKCLTAFSALYAGIASGVQARKMVDHLMNKKEFGTPYPCPSIAMNTPDIDPSLPTYGGGIEITSGLWFTIEGLTRYGQFDLAASYLLKAIKMMTKDGPSSSYSYHSVTGKYNQGKHTLAAQSVILTDLICKYIIGIIPDAHGSINVNPVALAKSGIKEFTFGPYLYGEKKLTVQYRAPKEYQVTVE
jgi:hypothetical protein